MIRDARLQVPALPALLLLCLAAACTGPSAPEDQGGGAVLIEPHHEAMWASGWLEFADLSLHTDAEDLEPVEPYVRGRILGGYFSPTGTIIGSKERPRGRRARFLIEGWLDLRTREFFLASEDEPLRPPYVRGLKDRDSGGFHPTSDIVHEAEPVAP